MATAVTTATATARATVVWTTRLTQPCFATTTTTTTTKATKAAADADASWVCRIPIVGAPMAGHAGGALAAAVCRAGGLAFIGCGHWLAAASGESGVQQLQEQVQLFRQEEARHKASYPLCLGFIGHSTFREAEGWERFERALTTYKPAVVQFFAPAVVLHDTFKSNVVLAQLHHAKVLAQVGTVKEAMEAVSAGVDGLIVQGSEAGGHGVRSELGNGTLSLAATVTAKLRAAGCSDVPVICAGGIVDGRTMAAALALGCDGVVLGTRLWASDESIGPQSFKDRLVAASSCDDVVRTTTFDCIQNTYAASPWPEPFDSVGALRNETSDTWDGRPTELAAALLRQAESSSSSSLVADEYRRACAECNSEIALVHSGEGVGLIHAIEPAYDIVTRISNEAAEVLRNLPKQLLSS